MAASIAIVRTLEQDMGLDVAKHAYLVAGHSLG
jgi:malonyl CoA-acyl carrier protein transacylase